MQKLTIFYIVATIMIVSVTGTLLGYKFFTKNGEEIQEKPTTTIADIADSNESTVPPNPVNIITSEKSSETAETSIKPSGEIDKATLITTDTSFLEVIATINKSKLAEAGFINANLTLSPSTGIIFNDIDLTDYRDDEHIMYEITEQTEKAGTITELIFPSDEIAMEIYRVILNKITEHEGFTINETNQYGDNSFFANNSEEKNSVFLVVKMGSRLYTLHYPAKNHNKMKNLINLF